MVTLNVLILFIVGYFFYDLLAMSYDEEFAQIRGVPVKRLYFLLVAMIALSVVMIIQIVGLILVIALLTIPAYIAEKFANSLSGMMFYSVLLNLFFTSVGLCLSYTYNLTSGASIIFVGGMCFLFVILLEQAWLKRR